VGKIVGEKLTVEKRVDVGTLSKYEGPLLKASRRGPSSLI